MRRACRAVATALPALLVPLLLAAAPVRSEEPPGAPPAEAGVTAGRGGEDAGESPGGGPEGRPAGEGRGGRGPVDPAAALALLATETAGAERGPATDPEQDPEAGSGLEGPPRRLAAGLEDDATRAAYLEAARAYYDYRVHGFRHRRGVFAWQLASSKVIFVVVVLLVLSGVYFSGVQFHSTLRAMKLAERRADTEEAPRAGPASLGGELEVGPERLKVSSPVLGVVILALSFLFFYLYIVHVHPIQEIL